MKTTTLFFAFLFLLFNSNAQNSKEKEENFFFRVELDSSGNCYGKSLLRSKWEVVTKEIAVHNAVKELTPIIDYEYDTIKTDYLFLEINNPNLKYIIDYIDTLNHSLMIREGYSKLNVTPSYYETVIETYVFRRAYESWFCNVVENILDSRNWNLNLSPPMYKEFKKQIVRTTGAFRYKNFPAEYIEIIKVIPKENISQNELNNINLISKQQFIYRIEKNNYIEKAISPRKVDTIKQLKLYKPCEIGYTEILCDTNSDLISKIKKQLFALGFYSGNFSKELNDTTKKAIIHYQIKHYLPIGQLDEETVNHILKQKTPFNK